MEIKTRTRSEVEEYTVKMHRNKGKFAIIFDLPSMARFPQTGVHGRTLLQTLRLVLRIFGR